MSATLEVDPLPACPDDSTFVNPSFNIVLLLSLYFISRPNRGSAFCWMIDFVAAGYLLAGTHHRSTIISIVSQNLCSDEESFYLFFVSSLASWIGATVLETRTCLHTAKTLMSMCGQARRGRTLLMIIPLTILALNSVIVMCLFCYDVFGTVSENTMDLSLFLYHSSASVAKVLSSASQGVFLVLEVCLLQNQDSATGHFLARMLFVNIVTVTHSSFLVTWGLPPLRWLLLMIDILFRLALCVFYLGKYLARQRQQIVMVMHFLVTWRLPPLRWLLLTVVDTSFRLALCVFYLGKYLARLGQQIAQSVPIKPIQCTEADPISSMLVCEPRPLPSCHSDSSELVCTPSGGRGQLAVDNEFVVTPG